MERFFFLDHHDFYPTADIRNEAARNQALLEAKIQDDIAILRADIATILQANSAFGEDGTGWALFFVPDEESIDGEVAESGTVVELQHGKEVLIVVGTGLEDTKRAFPVHDVRVLTNEYIKTEDQTGWLAYDFTLDADNDAQYFYSYFPLTLDKDVLEKARGVFFRVNDGQLQFGSNIMRFSPIVAVADVNDEGEEVEVVPFGWYNNTEDKIHALSVGRWLVDSVMNLEPVYVRPNPNTQTEEE